MSDDKVVYLHGGRSKPEPEKEYAERANEAVRQAFLGAVRAFRQGETRAVAIITLDKDGGSTWRIGGHCTDAEIVAALEFTKFSLLVEAD